MRASFLPYILLVLLQFCSIGSLLSQSSPSTYHPENYQALSYDSLLGQIENPSKEVMAIFANDSVLMSYYEYYLLELNKKGFRDYYLEQDFHQEKFEINWTEYTKAEYQRRYNGKEMPVLLQMGIAYGANLLIGTGGVVNIPTGTTNTK